MQPDDVVDLMAYLRTLPAGAGPPAAARTGVSRSTSGASIGFWKLLYLDRSPIEHDPARPGGMEPRPLSGRRRWRIARECHSSRNLFGGDQARRRASPGGRDPEGTGFVPNITPDRHRRVERGRHRAPARRTAARPICARSARRWPSVVDEHAALLPAATARAIAVYIKTPAAAADAEALTLVGRESRVQCA